MKRKYAYILLNAAAVSIIITAAYAIAVSHTYHASVALIAPGLEIFTTCGPTGPSNPVTTLNLGDLQVGGTNSVTLYLMNSVNGTVRLAWNSTISQASPNLTNTWITVSSFPLMASNCQQEGSSTTNPDLGGYGYSDINGTTLYEGHLTPTIYTVHALSSAVPGTYSWTLNLGVQ